MHKIKRPLALIGFTFFITGSMVLSMPGEYTAILLALFALFMLFHYFTAKRYTKHLAVMFITVIISVAYIFCYSRVYEDGIDKLPTDIQEYMGYVTAITNNENTGYTVAVLDEKNREKYSVSIYYGSEFELGDTVKITGKFSRNKNDQYIFSNYSKGIIGKITAKKMEHADVNISTVKYKTLTIRKVLLDSAETLYSGDYLALVSSMGYSDKHLVSDKLNSSFKTAGISHALVVSGFHVGIIVYAFQLLLMWLPIDKKVKNIAVSVVVIGFMYIIGLTPSVIRAGMLAAVILISANFRIEQDSLTTLAMVGLFCIIQNPYITRDIGAMLSYAAASGMVITNEYMHRKQIRGARCTFACATAAILFTMPVLALAGMYVTLLSPVFNFIFTIPIAVICVLSVFTPIIALIPFLSAFNGILVATNTYISAAFLTALDIIDRYFDFALINLSSPVTITMAAACIVALFVVCVQTDNKKIRIICVAAVSIIAFICYNLLSYNVVTVTAFDSGREASFHISSRGREYLVLSEWMTEKDAKERILSVNGREFENIYYCPKEFKYYTDYSSISKQLTEVSDSGSFDNGVFSLKSEISGNNKLFTITVNECDISFGHGKITSEDTEYYFLGNDKPKSVTAEEIYIFGNIPSWMEVEDITQISSDIKIRINLKTGEFKTVKDVFNFGY